LPVPLKLVHINRCPVLAPLSVLREKDVGRLQLDMAECQRRVDLLSAAQGVWQEKLPRIYGGDEFSASEDPEQQLYGGFFGDRDRRLCEQVRRAEPQSLGRQNWGFDDARLPELLFRYRARNFQETLTAAEGECWRDFCRRRLNDAAWGAPNTLEGFNVQLEQLLVQADSEHRSI
ncbi:exodeoxyribonuclease I, partial [Azotobacter chroococcum]|nr:exodeoxyribonuclease I [Azotobacter chroococcum]